MSNIGIEYTTSVPIYFIDGENGNIGQNLGDSIFLINAFLCKASRFNFVGIE